MTKGSTPPNAQILPLNVNFIYNIQPASHPSGYNPHSSKMISRQNPTWRTPERSTLAVLGTAQAARHCVARPREVLWQMIQIARITGILRRRGWRNQPNRVAEIKEFSHVQLRGIPLR